MTDGDDLPREGDRFRDPGGEVVRVICRGETFVTILYEKEPPARGEDRFFVPLRDWPDWSARLTPDPRP